MKEQTYFLTVKVFFGLTPQPLPPHSSLGRAVRIFQGTHQIAKVSWGARPWVGFLSRATSVGRCGVSCGSWPPLFWVIFHSSHFQEGNKDSRMSRLSLRGLGLQGFSWPRRYPRVMVPPSAPPSASQGLPVCSHLSTVDSHQQPRLCQPGKLRPVHHQA